MRVWLTAGLVLLAIAAAGAAPAGDPAKGQKVFQKCVACHDVGEKAQLKLGPPLNGIDGRHAGSYPGYTYSDANRQSGVLWGEATFRVYIRDPRAMIKGTKMAFVGIKNEREIADLWAFLKLFGPDGKKK